MSTRDAVIEALDVHDVATTQLGEFGASWSCSCGQRGGGSGARGAALAIRDRNRHVATAVADRLAILRAAQWRNTVTDAEDGDPWWRVVITDSESMTGVAPICVRQDERGSPHDHGDQRQMYDLRFDATGVYDCCPEPHIETYSTSTAAFLVELMNLRNVRMCT
jgi:hypothetical protein